MPGWTRCWPARRRSRKSCAASAPRPEAMPDVSLSARSVPTGDVQRGVMDAATEGEVDRAAAAPGRDADARRAGHSEFWLTALWHAEFTTRQGLRRQETADLTRELATMLGAGQDLDRALLYMVETAPNARVRSDAAATARRGARRQPAGGRVGAHPAQLLAACMSGWCAPARRAASLRRPWRAWPTCWNVSGASQRRSRRR